MGPRPDAEQAATDVRRFSPAERGTHRVTALLMGVCVLAAAFLYTPTFVHDWPALALGIVLAGHIGMAMGDPEAPRGMHTGSAARDWAERVHSLWRPWA